MPQWPPEQQAIAVVFVSFDESQHALPLPQQSPFGQQPAVAPLALADLSSFMHDLASFPPQQDIACSPSLMAE
jgi:hypothetical protein